MAICLSPCLECLLFIANYNIYEVVLAIHLHIVDYIVTEGTATSTPVSRMAG